MFLGKNKLRNEFHVTKSKLQNEYCVTGKRALQETKLKNKEKFAFL